VRPRNVRPVRWQIKGCQTTEPRTFDSGFSGKVNLSTLSFMVHLRTYLLPSVYPITYFRVSPLCTTKLDTPSLTRRSSFRRVRPETQLEVLFFFTHTIIVLRSMYIRSLFGTGTLLRGSSHDYIMTDRLSDGYLPLDREILVQGQFDHDRRFANRKL
jgi:hypothetical protein